MTDLYNTGVRPLIDQWLLEKAKEQRDYGPYWSASSAGYCQRKVIFERLGIPKVESEDDARKQRVFFSGHVFHEAYQRITKGAGVSIAQEEELINEDLMVKGHFDDVVVVGSPSANIRPDTQTGTGEGQTETKPHPQEINILDDSYLILYDYKTRNSRNFNYAEKPSYFHRMQLGTYLYMIRQLQLQEVKPAWLDGLPLIAEARTLNIEKDTLRQIEVQYLWDNDLEAEVQGYWTVLNQYWEDKKLPPCTCHEHENGFMAKEKWNGYFYEGEPCSIMWFQKYPEAAKKWRDA